MKRMNITALTLAVFLLLAGCGTIAGETPEHTAADTTSSQNEVISENTSDNAVEANVLIAYFSRIGNIDSEHEVDAISSASVVTQGDDLLGNMEYMANLIQNVAGGDIHFIETSEKYPSEYDSSDDNALDIQANKENRENARPELAAKIDNIETYDVVFLGFPKWYGDMPMAVYSFLDTYDLSGKKIYLFNSSGGSGAANAYSAVSDLEPDAVVEENIFSINHSKVADLTEQDIQKWLSEIGFRKADHAHEMSSSTTEAGKEMEEQTMVRSFDFNTKTVTLNSGYEMPINGIGTYSLLEQECVDSVTAALEHGVRLIDTANMYHNEAEVGEAVRNSGIPREEIFVTTKLYPNQYADAANAIEEALNKLDIGYIDLLLLHHPGTNDVDAYQAMEQAVADGKVRSIGLSNWYIEELEDFLPQITITPALVQNEIHPYYQENDVIPYIQGLGIVVQGWYPLGGRGHTAELLGNDVISAIAQTHGKSSAQVILRWNLQKGVAVIPGSSNPEHIRENTELYDFELTADEMEQINALNRDEKHDWY